PRRERPRGCCPAEQRDELATLEPRAHSITSSARASRDGDTSRASALAVCRLMTNSNLVDCMTGRSAGFAPLRTDVTPTVTIHLQIIGPIAHQPRWLQLARERYRSRVSHGAPRASQTGRGG